MIRFFVYDAITGEILRTGICQESMLEIQAKEGEVAVQGEANSLTQYFDIVAGELKDKPVDPGNSPANYGLMEDLALIYSLKAIIMKECLREKSAQMYAEGNLNAKDLELLTRHNVI